MDVFIAAFVAMWTLGVYLVGVGIAETFGEIPYRTGEPK